MGAEVRIRVVYRGYISRSDGDDSSVYDEEIGCFDSEALARQALSEYCREWPLAINDPSLGICSDPERGWVQPALVLQVEDLYFELASEPIMVLSQTPKGLRSNLLLADGAETNEATPKDGLLLA